MTATNHAVTGAAIGLIVGNPFIAIPAAIASHFICDALPHFDKPDSTSNESWVKSATFKRILIIDAAGCVILVSWLAMHHPLNWLLAGICAFAATSPDLIWLNRFIKTNRNRAWRPSYFSKFAASVQWFAKPIGAFVEVAWFAAGLIIILPFVR